MSDLEDSGFAPLAAALDDLAGKIEPGERRKLSRTIATDLRSANAKRIRANVTPEGDPMVPRKARVARIRSGQRTPPGRAKVAAMFRRASQPRFLRRESTDGEARVGFAGAMARIMRVHQYGLRDTVTRDPNSPAVSYPERPVIGITPDDRLRILSQLTSHLSGKSPGN